MSDYDSAAFRTRVDAVLNRAVVDNRDLTTDETHELTRLFDEHQAAVRADPHIRARLADALTTRDRLDRQYPAEKRSKAQDTDYRRASLEAHQLLKAMGYGVWLEQSERYGGDLNAQIENAREHMQNDENIRAGDAARAKFAPIFENNSDGPRSELDAYPATRALFAGTDYGIQWGIPEARAVDTTTGSNAILSTGYAGEFFGAISRQSVLLNTNPGPAVFYTDTTNFHLAASTAFAGASWVAEGGTATAADEGVTGVVITPDKLMRYQIVSNEALDDGQFPVLESLSNELFRSFAVAIDTAAYGTAGSTNGGVVPLLTNAGAGTASLSNAAITNLDPFVATAGSALSAGNQLTDLVWVTGAGVWQSGNTAHIAGTASNADVRPLFLSDLNSGGAAVSGSILGRPWYVTASTGMAAGTASDALLYDPTELAVVFSRRYSVILDRTTLAESDQTRIVASMRIGMKPIHAKGIARLSNIDAS